MVGFVTSGKQGLESFLDERLSALELVVRECTYEELQDPARLGRLLVNMKQAFGGFVDLGVLDDKGVQVAYAGPYELEGRSYESRPVVPPGRAARHLLSATCSWATATPRTSWWPWSTTPTPGTSSCCGPPSTRELINRLVASLATQPSADAFLLNQEGVLQTPSRSYGAALEQRPPAHAGAQRARPSSPSSRDERGEDLIVSYAQIEHSPFTLVLVSPQGELLAGWLALRRNLLIFLGVSVVLILAVVSVGTTHMVNRYREADMLRAAAYHKMEYTNKMAALGRLSAGVAHEINNPISIINEKAGLLKDLLLMSKETPPKEKLLELVDSVLRSADRCGNITHRLLGFAKHMEVRRETIDLDELLIEVLGFLEKEAAYRNITVEFDFPDTPPRIVSDRGQLQQVFLNIINNAFAAVEDHGRIEIGIREAEGDRSGGVDRRQRRGHRRGAPVAHLRPVLHHEEGGGNGAGALHHLRHRAEARAATSPCRARWVKARASPSRSRRARWRNSAAMDALRVLIVDDEEELVSALVERLRLRGFDARGVTTGAAALAYLETTACDVVVLDVKMPGLGGLEVIKRIKRERPELEVVLLTGHGSTVSVEEGMEAGAFEYLMKPVKIDDLARILRSAGSADNEDRKVDG